MPKSEGFYHYIIMGAYQTYQTIDEDEVCVFLGAGYTEHSGSTTSQDPDGRNYIFRPSQ